MFERWKHVKKRKKDIQSLREYIDKEFNEALASAKTPQEKGEAEQMAHSMTFWEQIELDYLIQEDTINALKSAPFEVPEEYWYDAGWGYKKTLTRKGHAWAKHELKKIRNADIEFWMKLVLPLVALVVSIIALLKKSH